MGKPAPPTAPIDHQAAPIPEPPPNYSEAASTSNPTTYHFSRHHAWSAKVLVQSAGVDRYCFAPGKGAQVWIYAGASTKNRPLGYLTFPASHNAFRLYFGAGAEGEPGPSGVDANGYAFSDVKARVGYPHASSFAFKSAASGRLREYEWVNRNPSQDASPVVYDLKVSGMDTLATLTVNRKGRGKTNVKWLKAPDSELEQAILILSAIGVITRLSKKAMYRDSDLAGGQRWFAFWWMAVLSTAAVM